MNKLTVLFALASTTIATAQSPTPRSGLQPGDQVIAFKVADITGPRRNGRPLCYACAFGKHTVINIHARNMNGDLMELIKQLDPLVSPPSRIRGDSKHAFLVLLTEEIDTATRQLKGLAKEYKIENIPFTIYEDLKGPQPYKLSKDAELTLMMWEQNTVKKNFAFAKDQFKTNDVQLILKEAKAHLGMVPNKTQEAQ